MKYHISSRIKKHWFKKDELVYDLIEYSVKDEWIDPSYGNGGGNFIPVKTEKTLFTSKDLDEVIIIKDKIQKTNGN